MPNTPNVNFKVINNAVNPTTPTAGVMFVSGVTERGPFNDASKIYTSWPQYTKTFGGLIAGSDFPLECKRAFEAGAVLRVVRQGHYTDITDAATLDAVKATKQVDIVQGTDELFSFTTKYEGAAYNDLIVEVKDATNGLSTHFNLEISLTTDSNVTEVYTNLNIPGTPDVANSDYLANVVVNSALVDVVYEDLSALTGPLRPTNVTVTYAGGSDGTAPNDVDYIGDAAAATGLHAFDEYDEAYFVTAPTQTSTAMATGGTAYASNRKDIIYLHPIANNLTTASAIEAFRTGTAINDDAMGFVGGGLRVQDPTTTLEKPILGLGTLLGNIATVHDVYNEWTSFAGRVKGIMQDSFGVVNNFGTQGKFDDLNLLANRQVNMFVVKDGLIYLNSGFTGALEESPLSFLSTKVFILYLQRLLRPILETYLEEPSDIPTFRAMYQEVKIQLDSLVEQRAMFNYRWDGDQDVNNIADMQINNPADVQQGRYKVNFYVQPIQPLQEVEVRILITPAGVSFS